MTISMLGYVVLKVVLQVRRNQKRIRWKRLWPNLTFCLGSCWENNDKPSVRITDVLLETSCWIMPCEPDRLLLN
jgi:hypothetical protein